MHTAHAMRVMHAVHAMRSASHTLCASCTLDVDDRQRHTALTPAFEAVSVRLQ
eukprot:CAMPEP_0197518348 /NCGR_PEP_ID=MMETSP1318-20131121/3524_1 /TAXON_ID=552666 /ORGANISM="Partenskyella glossopodia, Strain RCC365" /LENGTH=52 /DNA_ID=CAMNT_0043068625 /DNA_START=108 /DNA_END=263 /DNA_ORIENTATION=+